MALNEITLSATQQVNEWLDGIRRIKKFWVEPETNMYIISKRNEFFTSYGEVIEHFNVMSVYIKNQKGEKFLILFDLKEIKHPQVYMRYGQRCELSLTADFSICEHLLNLIYNFPNETANTLPFQRYVALHDKLKEYINF